MRAAGALGARGADGRSRRVRGRRPRRAAPQRPALGVVNGDRGVVVAVDRDGRDRSTSSSAGRQVRARLRDYLDAPTRHGRRAPARLRDHRPPRPGLTCRQTFVLATDRISREWATSRSAAAARATGSTRLGARPASATSTRRPSGPAAGRAIGSRPRSSDRRRMNWQATQAARSGSSGSFSARTRSSTPPVANAMPPRRRHAELERVAPHPLRRGARRQHQQALTRARDTEERAAGRVAACRDRVNAVLAELQRVRRVESRRQEPQRAQRLERPERVLDRAAGAGWEIGR